MYQVNHSISTCNQQSNLFALFNRQGAEALSPTQKEVSLFGKLYERIEGLINEFRGFEIFTNNKTHKCEGIIISPDRLDVVQARLDHLMKHVLASFIPRIPDAHPETIWKNRFNLEIVASSDRIDCIALFISLPSKGGLKFSTKNMTELFFSIRSKTDVFEVYVNLTEPEPKFVDRGTYLYTPLTYYTQEQSFNGTGLHPKLTRRYAIEINRKEVFASLKYDDSCIILIQESLDRGNYIDIDEVKDDKSMVTD